MSNVKLGIGKQVRDLLAVPLTYERGKIDDSSIDSLMWRYQNIIDGVVSAYYSTYSDYVEACDLYAQAYLTFVQAFEEGLFKSDVRRVARSKLQKRIQAALYEYCMNEYKSFIVESNVDAVVPEAVQSAVRKAILEVLNTLSERERRVIILYFFEGYNLVEIAEMLNVSSKTTSCIFRKGLGKMRHPKRSKKLEHLLDLYE